MEMAGEFQRACMLLGQQAMERLRQSAVAVFGIGGVGGFTAEALARSGVGAISLFDHDVVTVSNINRQIIALHSTVGRKKVEVMRERLLDINPEIQAEAHDCFYSAETADQIDLGAYDYVVDAIDTVSSKLLLAERAAQTATPIISCMGTGNKLDPSRFEIADIYQTSVCPLARVMRRELKARGIRSLKVLYSAEPPLSPDQTLLKEEAMSRRQTPGSLSFVPSVAGLMIAGEVIRDLVGIELK